MTLAAFAIASGFSNPPFASAQLGDVVTDTTDDDQAVINAVLQDLLSPLSDDSPLASPNGSPPDELLVVAKPISRATSVKKVLHRYRRKLWDALTPAQLESAEEAAADLVDRVEKSEVTAPFTSQDARVQMHDDGDKLQPRVRPVRAWLPGYSGDRRTAVVRLIIPWSIHHAEGTYILTKDSDNNWTVTLRQFVYYP